MNRRLRSVLVLAPLLIGSPACDSEADTANPSEAAELAEADAARAWAVKTTALRAAFTAYSADACTYVFDNGGTLQTAACDTLELFPDPSGVLLRGGGAEVRVSGSGLPKVEFGSPAPMTHSIVWSRQPLRALELRGSTPQQLAGVLSALDFQFEDTMPVLLESALAAQSAGACHVRWEYEGQRWESPCDRFDFVGLQPGSGVSIVVRDPAVKLPMLAITPSTMASARVDATAVSIAASAEAPRRDAKPMPPEAWPHLAERAVKVTRRDGSTIRGRVQHVDRKTVKIAVGDGTVQQVRKRDVVAVRIDRGDEPVSRQLELLLSTSPPLTIVLAKVGPEQEQPLWLALALGGRTEPSSAPTPAVADAPRVEEKRPLPAEAWPPMKGRKVLVTVRSGAQLRGQVLDVHESSVTLVGADGLVFVVEMADAITLRIDPS